MARPIEPNGQDTINESEQILPVVNEPKPANVPNELPTEFGGQKGPEPTRYGDWEKNGRCTDF